MGRKGSKKNQTVDQEEILEKVNDPAQNHVVLYFCFNKYWVKFYWAILKIKPFPFRCMIKICIALSLESIFLLLDWQ